MAVSVEALKHSFSPQGPLYIRFALEILVGAAVYTLALVVLHRDWLRAVFRLAEGFRGQAL